MSEIRRLQELTDYLNRKYFCMPPLFSISECDEKNVIKYNDFNIISFAKDGWHIEAGLGTLNSDIQNIVVNYANRTSVKDWFYSEKKYNIVVGLSYGDDEVTAYHKTEKEVWYNEFDEVMCLSTFVSKNDLKRDEYMFTEQEITTLKLSLPENMQQIVDLGKVEVKDENN